MLETVFTGLLALAAVAVTWFSGLVVYKLYKGQG